MTRKYIHLLVIFLFLALDVKCFADDEVFLVKDIEVYKNDLPYAEAKDMAITESYEKAINILSKRILMLQDTAKLSQIKVSDIAATVKSHEIVWERQTANSYRAKVNVTFAKNKITEFLDRKGIRYGTRYSPQTLIIPVISRDNNYKILNTMAGGNFGLIRASFPCRGLGNLLPNDHSILHASSVDFANIMAQHQAKNLIAIYVEEERQAANVNLRFIINGQETYRFVRYNRRFNEVSEEFWQRITINMMRKIDMLWKGVNSFDSDYFVAKVVIKEAEIASVIKSLRTIPQLQLQTELLGKLYYALLFYRQQPAELSLLLQKKGIDVIHKGDVTYLSINNHD